MELRYYQKEAVQAIFDYFATHSTGNPALALPTGTGKAVILAQFVKEVLMNWPNQRILVLSHVKELLVQDCNKLLLLWPNAPVGIYSAGLGEYNTSLPIIFGGIASVNSNPELFGHRDIIIVDECHMISTNESSMYQKVITKLKLVNPYVRIVGLSATCYRMGQGKIVDDGLFTDIAYDVTGYAAFNRLIAEGFISTLIPKRTNIQLNTDNVKISNGEFQQKGLQEAVDIDEVTYSAIKELIEFGYDRHCGLVFTTGQDHCEHVCSAIQSFGESASFVHSKMPTKDRDKAIRDFKAGVFKYLVCVGIASIGFDHPPIDILGILRPTMSTAWWVQALGRGTRPYTWMNEQQYIAGYNYEKDNCLVLDFAGNTKRLGPINDPVLPRPKGQKTGDAPIRICPSCGVYNHASARFCCSCGHKFDMQVKIFGEASSDELIKSDLPVVETFVIQRTIYHKHFKNGSPPMIQASYYSGLKIFKEFVCIEHFGYAKTKAQEWWKQRTTVPFPSTVDEALQVISSLKSPAKIHVQINLKYPVMVGYEY